LSNIDLFILSNIISI